MNNNLAIIIPAYKTTFLKKTLDSLQSQTCKEFKVYIGDDNSPFDLEKIVDDYKSTLDLMYIKFETNLGSLSLVKQWERVVELSDREWIWLFSDDDLISKTAVESFYRTRNQFKNDKFFKFHTKMIDVNDAIVPLYNDKTNLESHITSEKFITDRLTFNRFRSYAVEYVFHRDLYNTYKFVEFPLAWYSDDATWLQFSFANEGIRVIDDNVYWRFSGENISSNNSSKDTVLKKTNATKAYSQWLYNFKTNNNLTLKNKDILFSSFVQLHNLNHSISSLELREFANNTSISFCKKDIESAIQKVRYLNLKVAFLSFLKKIINRK